MLPFGLGDYVESALKPHLIYYRRQGTLLAVAGVFAATTLLFAVLTVFLALTYIMPAVWAAVLCALICAAVVMVLLSVVQRRARLRARTSAEVVAVEQRKDAEITAARLRAAASFFSSVGPALAVGLVAFLLGRRR